MGGSRCFISATAWLVVSAGLLADSQTPNNNPLSLPPVGSGQVRVITPALLELTFISTKLPDPAPVREWNFVDSAGRLNLPPPEELAVYAGSERISVKRLGFKRRVLYAPFKQRDLRIANSLYLELTRPVNDNSSVEVKNPDQKLWKSDVGFVAKADPERWSPAVHVNQTGYLPSFPKQAMIGYYLGSLGELDVGNLQQGDFQPTSSTGRTGEQGRPAQFFALLDAIDGKEVFRGSLVQRPDKGFPFPCYQRVLEADFSSFKTPGEYRLFVPGLGVSFPFLIDDRVSGAFARTYALGIYHQRCGTDNALPFTRFAHAACHTAPAEVPEASSKFESANNSLSKESANFKENPRHTAPQLKSMAASLYPFVRRGQVDVRGGHHDAGDYSKYTINSASFVHHLIFAADTFPGVSDLDNLGLPESGDGKSDVLQEAKWEADFLAKLQDSDGGFYFLVYPRDREYENNVTPDKGDPQIVFPKTTSATAAAVAALAQCASSPTFRRQFPAAASDYLKAAKKGWDFLERAIAKYGKDGAYQKITHYGDEFMHDDELAWASCELFLATGDPAFQQKLLQWLNPADPNTRRWGWWRLFDSYGCAIRSYAFAARSGRLKREQLSPLLLEQCENEIAAAGEEQLRRAEDSAYGTSFPEETKRVRSAGWYFSSDAAFDLAVACQLDYPSKKDPRPRMIAALLSNVAYEQGCNPVNVVYLTGLGWKRQREIVHQFAQNDRRVLPPDGIPLGNIQGGFGWNSLYQKELDKLAFPSDGRTDSPYPFYDRWGDAFNLSQEFVIVNQARGLAYCAWLMAQTSLKAQPWKSIAASITPPEENRSPSSELRYKLVAPGLDLSSARIIWEAERQEPLFGVELVLKSDKTPPRWIEAEAQLPDGRRAFAVRNFARGDAN
jgi:hypothetical protein